MTTRMPTSRSDERYDREVHYGTGYSSNEPTCTKTVVVGINVEEKYCATECI